MPTRLWQRTGITPIHIALPTYQDSSQVWDQFVISNSKALCSRNCIVYVKLLKYESVKDDADKMKWVKMRMLMRKLVLMSMLMLMLVLIWTGEGLLEPIELASPACQHSLKLKWQQQAKWCFLVSFMYKRKHSSYTAHP